MEDLRVDGLLFWSHQPWEGVFGLQALCRRDIPPQSEPGPCCRLVAITWAATQRSRIGLWPSPRPAPLFYRVSKAMLGSGRAAATATTALSGSGHAAVWWPSPAATQRSRIGVAII